MTSFLKRVLILGRSSPYKQVFPSVTRCLTSPVQCLLHTSSAARLLATLLLLSGSVVHHQYGSTRPFSTTQCARSARHRFPVSVFALSSLCFLTLLGLPLVPAIQACRPSSSFLRLWFCPSTTPPPLLLLLVFLALPLLLLLHKLLAFFLLTLCGLAPLLLLLMLVLRRPRAPPLLILLTFCSIAPLPPPFQQVSSTSNSSPPLSFAFSSSPISSPFKLSFDARPRALLVGCLCFLSVRLPRRPSPTQARSRTARSTYALSNVFAPGPENGTFVCLEAEPFKSFHDLFFSTDKKQFSFQVLIFQVLSFSR